MQHLPDNTRPQTDSEFDTLSSAQYYFNTAYGFVNCCRQWLFSASTDCCSTAMMIPAKSQAHLKRFAAKKTEEEFACCGSVALLALPHQFSLGFEVWRDEDGSNLLRKMMGLSMEIVVKAIELADVSSSSSLAPTETQLQARGQIRAGARAVWPC